MATNYGGKVSKPGFDVLTADPKDLVFSSKFFTNKLFMYGTVNVTTNSGPDPDGFYYGSSTLSHNLGYNPIYLAYALFGSRLVKQNYVDLTYSIVVFPVKTSTTQLIIEMYQTINATFGVKYFVFHDNGIT